MYKSCTPFLRTFVYVYWQVLYSEGERKSKRDESCESDFETRIYGNVIRQTWLQSLNILILLHRQLPLRIVHP